MFHKLILIIGSIGLGLFAMFLFFGGEWEGVRFGLEILGGVYVFQLIYSGLTKELKEKEENKKSDEIAKKYF